MNPVSLASIAQQRMRRFVGDQDGVSAVEFALLLPLMLTLYLGGVEVSQAVSADRKTMLVAHSIGDIISQYSCVTSSDMTNIFSVGQEVVYPYDPNNLKATATSVTVDANGRATVAWSQALNGGTVRSGDVTSLIPAALLTASLSSSLIWAEASYSYRPTVGYVITGTLTLNEKIFLRPRLTNAVAYPTCT